MGWWRIRPDRRYGEVADAARFERGEEGGKRRFQVEQVEDGVTDERIQRSSVLAANPIVSATSNETVNRRSPSSIRRPSPCDSNPFASSCFLVAAMFPGRYRGRCTEYDGGDAPTSEVVPLSSRFRPDFEDSSGFGNLGAELVEVPPLQRVGVHGSLSVEIRLKVHAMVVSDSITPASSRSTVPAVPPTSATIGTAPAPHRLSRGGRCGRPGVFSRHRGSHRVTGWEQKRFDRVRRFACGRRRGDAGRPNAIPPDKRDRNLVQRRGHEHVALSEAVTVGLPVTAP